MENYIVKVVIENANGKVISQAEFNTQNIAEIKAFGGNNPVDDYIETTLDTIRDDRRTNPHHHQNRLD